MLAAEAGCEVIRAAATVRWSSFGGACRQLGDRTTVLEPTQSKLGESQRRQARRIGNVVQATAEALGGIDTCFVQSLAAARMLRRRSIPTLALIGVKPRADARQASLDSHAWLVAGRLIVTGAGPHRCHDAVLGFVNQPASTAGRDVQ